MNVHTPGASESRLEKFVDDGNPPPSPKGSFRRKRSGSSRITSDCTSLFTKQYSRATTEPCKKYIREEGQIYDSSVGFILVWHRMVCGVTLEIDLFNQLSTM